MASQTGLEDSRRDACDDSGRTGAHPTLLALRSVMVLAVVIPALLYAAAAVYLRQQALAEARARVDSAVRVSEEHALKIFETNEALLSRVLDMLGHEADEPLRGREQALYERLSRMSEGLAQLQGIWLVGSDGRLIAASRVFPAPRALDFTDRDYFRHHRDGGPQPYFTEVLTSRSTGEPFFDMSLRRSDREGRFAGVVNVSLTPHYFAGFYRELAGGDPALQIALLRADGGVMAAWPREPMPTDVAGASSMRASSMHTTTPVDDLLLATMAELPDGQRGLIASRRLGTYPLHVNAWIERSAIFAGWQRQITLLAMFMLPMAGGLAFLARLALQRTRRALDVAAALREETEQRARAESALQQSQKLEALGRLTGGVAHDFNNLLTVIGNNVYLHKRTSPEAAGSAQLAAIERAVAAGGKLTGQLLSFSRRRTSRAERVELQQRLPAIVDLLTPTLGGRIEVHTSIEPATAAILVDPSELELALLNLALNAKDAMPDGGRLELSAADVAAGSVPGIDGPTVVIAVRDSGQGMAPEVLEHAFEPFFTTKPIGQGTGLGLSQVYGFCQRAHGVATIESRIGRGTTMRLHFPAAPRTVTTDAAALAGNEITGTRVLLVDDDHEVADATRAVLESLGCSVEHVQDAGRALDLIDGIAVRTDLVVSDIRMPGTVDGIELGSRLQAEYPELPVILMSGYSESIEEAGRLGLTVLHKPCAPDRLAGAIRTALDRRRGRVVAARNGAGDTDRGDTTAGARLARLGSDDRA